MPKKKKSKSKSAEGMDTSEREWFVPDTSSLATVAVAAPTPDATAPKSHLGFPVKKIKKKVLSRRAKSRKDQATEKAVQRVDQQKTRIIKNQQKEFTKVRWKNLY